MDQKSAIAAWHELLGSENVLTQESTLRTNEIATFLTKTKICAILRPKSSQEVQECLKIANQYQIPLYPVSSGKNWGYGSRVPTSDGCALMELGNMNRIVDFSEELGYVTLEPGVTQRQLYQFLQDLLILLFREEYDA